MRISRDFFDRSQSFTLEFEDGDTFNLTKEDIIDVALDVRPASDKYGSCTYFIDDGFLEISAAATRAVSQSVFAGGEDGEMIVDEHIDLDYNSLSNRLRRLCDLCAISILRLSENVETLYVPYSPLKECINNNIIEMSNCPSYIAKENGNVRFFMGYSSSSPRRKDNNYSHLIIGWENFYGSRAELPEILSVRPRKMSNLSVEEKCPRLLFTLEVRNRACRNKRLELLCEGYKNLTFDIYPECFQFCNLLMSRMSNGRIFVALEGINIQLDCACIRVYENGFESGYAADYETCLKAIALQLDEQSTEQCAKNHMISVESILDIEAVSRAFLMAACGDITVNHFRCWLKLYSEFLFGCEAVHFKRNSAEKKIALLLDELYLKIAYADQTEEIKLISEKCLEDILSV